MPRIHNKDPFSFHSWNVLPSINHPAVPYWWTSQAVLWLIDGSGGESHDRNLSRNWFPVIVYQSRQSAIWYRGATNVLSHAFLFLGVIVRKRVSDPVKTWRQKIPCKFLATAIRDSSFVSESSRSSATSTSLLPTSVFKNLSGPQSAKKNTINRWTH